MPQTDYALTPNRGRAGLPYDGRAQDRVTVLNEESSAMPFGIMVKDGATEGGCLLPAAAGDTPKGVLLHFHEDPDKTGVEADALGTAVKKGAMWVLVEEDIALGDRVFYRHTATGAEQAGAFRNDADGTAQVDTVTPTAANDTQYKLAVLVRDPSDLSHPEKHFVFEVLSDSTATAAEICDDFRTAMQGDAVFNALVTSSGTTTLVLTAADASVSFDTDDVGDGILAVAATQAAAPDCEELPKSQAKWLGANITVGADKYAPLELNLA